MKTEWNGRNHWFNLHDHTNNNTKSNNTICRVSEFVQDELTNEHTRIGHLLKHNLRNHPHSGVYSPKYFFETEANLLLLYAPKTAINPNKSIPSVQLRTIRREKSRKGELLYWRYGNGIKILYQERVWENNLGTEENME